MHDLYSASACSKLASWFLQHKDTEGLEKLGGPEGLAKALRTDLDEGLNPEATDDTAIQRRRQLFGANKFPQVPLKSFFALLWGNLSDKILILLMVAATISTVLGAALPEERAQSGWTEGVAIWVAVIVVSLVATGNDYQKDLQFRKINSQKNSIEVAVVRGGTQTMAKNTDIVVGDIMLLNTGDKIIADGIVTDSHGLVIDEASLTGESDPMHKGDKDRWCRSGTQVTEGSGKMLVVAVGTESEWGRTMALVATEASPTPLQDSLGVLATAIGKIGLTVGVVCFVVLFVRWLVQNKGFPVDQISEGPLAFFIFGVTIVVVAVPEGLPLAVTISLAYSMKKMMKDNNFVRVLAACETMGGATAICSDKTGTLTENRMTVVAGWFAGKIWPSPPPLEELPETLQADIKMNSALNSKAFLIEHDENAVEFAGNRTECALLMLLRGWGIKYDAIRAEHKSNIFHVYNFTSERKMASMIVRTPEGLRLYNKGAAEIVLRRCVSVMDPSGNVVPLEDAMRAVLEETVTTMASTGLRTLCLTKRDIDESLADGQPEFWENPPDDNLTLCCIVGIKDPVRKEVPGAVATCQRAGIMVRMVTGDNIHTAKHIARECGILTDGGTAMEGPVFRSMPEEDLIPMVEIVQVLARSSPQDKYVLVKLLKKLGEIVAVTGDGTNDAPALKESDVGLAMGIAGTEVAKEAADIVILDDNFSSIVKSVLWGRSVFGNIRKFLQFQLTVNFVALVVAFIAAITSGETPLNVLQLLWVNLIMDALGALALATEPPTPGLLLEKPHGRDEQLISPKMWKHILAQGFYQLFWLFLIFYGAPADHQYKERHSYDLRKTNSIVFNAFIFMQLVNQINARKINDELNVFKGIFHAPMFLYIYAIEIILQVIIMVTPINRFFRVSTQNWQEWLFAIALGAGALPVALLTKLLTRAFAPMGSWLMQRPTAVAAKHSLGRRRRHLQGAKWCPCMKPPPIRLDRASHEEIKPAPTTA
ncbi:calcium-translocating P-type ATPase [Coccomyxa subellipsoidea C-169]|uniref:Calcium-transporting ATPase n=1 Tax=Coccomyxa subellipsoidea (strain C-169) TaxID=574566 RepID=I0YM73_COCSC|nr:calcium-translocating P-type ATPase [Coccomyxa subellipsoidea C-169]EIE19492.1 calcium-translocating P-type ATPase [Coccomyxa subellipsoidea C-169]|eukprot:XP_005644036.1 calcium-translocating P-type ATPase [Coccomyxa subellipsoidea C-169]